jgi:hypothetical protein
MQLAQIASPGSAGMDVIVISDLRRTTRVT